MGSTIAVMVAGGLGLGMFLDGRVVTSPLFTLVGLGVGVLAASVYLYSIAKKYWKE
ncbi:AtpZ/AtpI family protein [Sciscionella sediminilitoris]|uniref:AtpZ/AtpI family protein n=1 Tax=Sciscionella sediminilitoris TaxID=1445613 RepID=UPI0018D1C8BD|nr:AtpZ/AtpI family protein [Sciscionella sp. SE31]